MIRIVVAIGFGGAVQNQRVAAAQTLHPMPDSGGHHHQARIYIPGVKLHDKASGVAPVARVVQHDFHMAGIDNVYDRLAARIPFGTKNLGDDAMVAWDMAHLTN